MSFRRAPISEEVALKIHEILCEHAGERRPDPEADYDLSRDSFVRYATEGTWTEYRFCGSLGFGGKVWFNAGHWYVTCYREDETPERLAAIAATNAALDKLWEETWGEPPQKY